MRISVLCVLYAALCGVLALNVPRPTAPPATLSRRAAVATTAAAVLLPSASRAEGEEVAWGAQVFAPDLVWQPRTKIVGTQVAKGATPYPTYFITYLSRFLLNFDESSAQWWALRAAEIPRGLSRAELLALRQKQFGQFSESVELGTRQFSGAKGSRLLFSLLRSRYGGSQLGKLQIAMLFSLLEDARLQPTELVARVLGEIDNSTVVLATLSDGGSGYTGEPPLVTVTPPDAEQASGSGGEDAVVRAVTKRTGALRRLELVSGGGGYTVSRPVLTVSPPAGGGRAATGEAIVNGGRGPVVALKLTDGGSGYADGERIVVTVDPPRDDDDNPIPTGRPAEAEAIAEVCVSSLEVVSGGAGYGLDQRVNVSIAPPQECGGEADGEGAKGAVLLRRVVRGDSFKSIVEERQSNASPFLYLQPPGSVSEELLRLLPSALRPLRRADGSFYVPLARLGRRDAAAVRGGARIGIGSLSYRGRGPTLGRDPIFGPLGTSPVQREVALSAKEYLSFAASGAACTATVRTLLAPLDVTKTAMQSAPAQYEKLLPSMRALYDVGGVSRLFTAVDVTIVGAAILGGVGFGVNEFLRRFFTEAAGGPGTAALYAIQITIGASLTSQVLSSILVCPLEVLRIRAVSASIEEVAKGGSKGAGGGGGGEGSAADAYKLPGGLLTLWAEGGLGVLYAPLLPLLLRELPFTVAKFLVFDAASQAITAAAPASQETPAAAAGVALLAGCLAGIAGAVVSNPADAILTLAGQQQQPAAKGGGGGGRGGDEEHAEETGNAALLATASRLAREEPLALFRGFVPRAVFFGSLIAGQFLLYDYWKQVFRVSTNDITLVLDVFADRMSFYQ